MYWSSYVLDFLKPVYTSTCIVLVFLARDHVFDGVSSKHKNSIHNFMILYTVWSRNAHADNVNVFSMSTRFDSDVVAP